MPTADIPIEDLERSRDSPAANQREIAHWADALPADERERFTARQASYIRGLVIAYQRIVRESIAKALASGTRFPKALLWMASGSEIAPLGVCDAVGVPCDATWAETVATLTPGHPE